MSTLLPESGTRTKDQTARCRCERSPSQQWTRPRAFEFTGGVRRCPTNPFWTLLFRHPFVLVPVLFYGITVSHQIGLPDSAIAIESMAGAVLSAHVCSHNLTNLLGWVFLHVLPFQNVALKANLVSVACGSAAMILFYAILIRLNIGRLIAALGTAILMVSHSAWWHSTRVENYALSLMLMNICILLVQKDVHAGRAGPPSVALSAAEGAMEGRPDPPKAERRVQRPRPTIVPLIALCFFSALSVFNHVQNAVLLIATGIYLVFRSARNRITVRQWLWLAIAVVIGLLPYLAAFGLDMWRNPSAGAFWAAGGRFYEWFSFRNVPDGIRALGHLLFLQFPSPFLLFIPAGLFIALRDLRRPGINGDAGISPPLQTFLWPALVIPLVVFLNYRAWDLFSFYLQAFSLLALFGTLALARLGQRMPVRAAVITLAAVCIALPPFIYPHINQWASRTDSYWERRYGAYLAEYATRYSMVDLLVNPLPAPRGESIDDFARLLFTRLPVDSMFIDDVTTYHQLLHFQRFYGTRTDIDFRLVQPDGFEGWGTPFDQLVQDMLASPPERRIFTVAALGVCARLEAAMMEYGWVMYPFELSTGRSIFELRRPGVFSTATGVR